MTNKIKDVIMFMQNLYKRYDISKLQLRAHRTALEHLSNCVQPGDPDDLEWMVDNMKVLKTRWGQANPKRKALTAQSYESRAKQAIREYLKWNHAPDKYRGWPTKGKRKQVPLLSQKVFMDSFRFGDGRSIMYRLPEEGLYMRDVAKIFAHLVTLADDFQGESIEEICLWKLKNLSFPSTSFETN